MTSIRQIQNKIKTVEGFDLRLFHTNGRDARDDKKINGDYAFERAAKGNFTVNQYLRRRLGSLPAGLVPIIMANGHPVHGRTLLKNLR